MIISLINETLFIIHNIYYKNNNNNNDNVKMMMKRKRRRMSCMFEGASLSFRASEAQRRNKKMLFQNP